MSRRKKAAARFSGRPLYAGSAATLVHRGDRSWWVQPVRGSAKTYTCPGCLGSIDAELAHVVVWPEMKSLLSSNAIDERRHWHTQCWQRGL